MRVQIKLFALFALLFPYIASAQIYPLPASPLSKITQGGAYNPATDKVVTVRSGAQDKLTTLPATSGTVTSIGLTGDGVLYNSVVTGSPVTTAGTLVPSLLAQTANRIFAGPVSGGVANPTFRALGGTDVFTFAICSSSAANQQACGAFYGYSNLLWYGASNNNTGDIRPALVAAANDACSGGWLRVKLTWGVYQKQGQFDYPCNGLVIFADPQNTAYDGDNQHAAVTIHENTGFYTSVNNCGFNQNGFVDQVIDGINFHGDGGQQGTVEGCNSHNTSGGDQIPRFYFRNGSTSGMGNTVGCSLKLSGVTGSPQCFTGTGNTQNNLVTARFENWKFTQNAVGVAAGNVTDLYVDKNSEIAGNACGAINATLDGTEGVYIGAFRTEENGINGFSGICGSGSPTIEVTGPYWNIDTQFQNNNGVALLFDHSCGSDGITGGFSGDGLKGTSGAESEIAFNASCASTISFNGEVGSVDSAFGVIAPKYFAENISGTNVISYVGGNLDSSLYTVSRDHIVAGGLTYDKLLTLGQQAIFSGTAITPADNAACTAGTFWWDIGFIYVCTASGTVKRTALSTY